ncbi:stress response protein Rds1 [Pyronema omphalodes]|nr:stress response protein Rds1 [Pyronema omphalodes]
MITGVAGASIISTGSIAASSTADGSSSSQADGNYSPQAATATESDPEQATGSPGRIPEGNPPEPVNVYPNTGNLTRPEPMPYMPAGGINTSPDDIPVYQAFSDFDWQSLSLALYQEWIELDLFQEGLRRFSVEDFEAANLTADDRSLIEFMAEQEVGHATMISNILGPNAPRQCEYQYPFQTVPEFIDFCQKLTRWGESGVYGFLEHLDSRAAAQLLLQSITTEARQQMIFRQFEGLFPMPVWFETGVPQSFAWTLLAPYIKSCPAENPRLAWQNFPTLHILNNPNATAESNSTDSSSSNSTDSSSSNSTSHSTDSNSNSTSTDSTDSSSSNSTSTDSSSNNTTYPPAITHRRPELSSPGSVVHFLYEPPGQAVGPNMSYITSTSATSPPQFAVWLSQLNVTYTPLFNVSGNEAYTNQPNLTLFSDLNQVVNGTVFVALTDLDLYVTPHNVSLILPHVVAGPGLWQAD